MAGSVMWCSGLESGVRAPQGELGLNIRQKIYIFFFLPMLSFLLSLKITENHSTFNLTILIH